MTLKFFIKDVKIRNNIAQYHDLEFKFAYFVTNIIHVNMLNSNTNCCYFFLRGASSPSPHAAVSVQTLLDFAMKWKKCYSISDFTILLLTNYNTALQIILVQSHHFYFPAEVHFNTADVTWCTRPLRTHSDILVRHVYFIVTYHRKIEEIIHV